MFTLLHNCTHHTHYQNEGENRASTFISISRSDTCSNYYTIALISHASKIMFKILQARLQHYMNHELPDVQAGFTKGRGTRDQISNIPGII